MRQLSLFRSKRQRGVSAPAPLEFASHAFIADLLKRFCNPLWRYTHIPLGEYRSKATAAKLKRMGVMPGWPDFQFAGRGQRMFFLELKRRGGRLSIDQTYLVEHLRESGFDVMVTDNVNHAVERLKQLDILPSKIEVR